MKIKYNKEVNGNIKSLVIPVDIYKCSVEILMPKEAHKLAEKWDEKVNCGAVTNNYLNSSGVVLIRLYDHTDATLVHELVHAAQIIMHSIGHNHAKDEADEPIAYLVGYLFAEAKQKIKKYKKK